MSLLSVPWDFALILFVLAVLVPWRGAVKMRQLLERAALGTSDRLKLYATTIAFQWFGTTLVLWRALRRGLTLQTLGFALPDTVLIISVALGLSLLLAANQVIGIRRLSRHPEARKSFVFQMALRILPQNLVESLAFVALVVTVALCEEIIYRGFVIAAVSRGALDSSILGAFISSLLFAIAHAYQGRRGVMVTLVIGLIFAGARLWTGSLIPGIAAHLTADLVAGLAAPRALRSGHFPALGSHDENS